MRGLSAGESPANFEVVENPEQTGALSYPEATPLNYEIPLGDPSGEREEGCSYYVESLDTVPTISEINEPTEEQKDKHLDNLIEQIYAGIEKEKKADGIYAEIAGDVSLNKLGYLPDSTTTNQAGMAILPSIIDTSTIELTQTESLEIDSVISEAATENVEGRETYSDIIVTNEQQREHILGVDTVEAKHPINNDAWESAFSYSVSNGVVESEDVDRPIFKPDGFVSRLARKLHIIEPEPLQKKVIVQPSFIQAELDTASSFIHPGQQETAWLDAPEATVATSTVEQATGHDKPEFTSTIITLSGDKGAKTNVSTQQENYPSVTVDESEASSTEILPGATAEPDVETDFQAIALAEDEVAIQELLSLQMEKFIEKKSEPKKVHLVSVPTIVHTLPVVETTVDPVAEREVLPVATLPLEAVAVKNVETASSKPKEASKIEQGTAGQRSEAQRMREIEAMKRLDLSKANSLEVAFIAKPKSMKARQLDLIIQLVIDNYKGKYSRNEVWRMYCDGNIGSDGIVTLPSEQDRLNRMIIKSLELVDDTQFALAA